MVEDSCRGGHGEGDGCNDTAHSLAGWRTLWRLRGDLPTLGPRSKTSRCAWPGCGPHPGVSARRRRRRCGRCRRIARTRGDNVTIPRSTHAHEGDNMTHSTLPTVQHWIAGAERPSVNDRTWPIYNPAQGKQTKHLALADEGEIRAAIDAAQAAFPAWRDLSMAKRQAVLFRFRELLNNNIDTLAEIITSE